MKPPEKPGRFTSPLAPLLVRWESYLTSPREAQLAARLIRFSTDLTGETGTTQIGAPQQVLPTPIPLQEHIR
jgi:hypothetical protein